MPARGIKIIAEETGSGLALKKGDCVRVKHDVRLNRGDYPAQEQETFFTSGDRDFIAGLGYGLEGMKAGGSGKFKASPHLCHRDIEFERIPKNEPLIFDVKEVEVLSFA